MGVTFDSGEFSGLEFQAAVDAIAAALEQKGFGEKTSALPPARLGHFASALLGLPYSSYLLWCVRRGTRTG